MKREPKWSDPAKLILHRETLRDLERAALREVAGGISRSLCIPCPM